MAKFRCYHCKHPSRRPGRYHEFEADKPLCPKCGAGEPAVLQLVGVHFLYGDRMGPIEGRHGLRYRVACEPSREILAAHLADDYAASGDPRAVTCPSCLTTPHYRRAASIIKELRQMMLAAEPGCCG
jgi:hypothetical protein